MNEMTETREEKKRSEAKQRGRKKKKEKKQPKQQQQRRNSIAVCMTFTFLSQKSLERKHSNRNKTYKMKKTFSLI